MGCLWIAFCPRLLNVMLWPTSKERKADRLSNFSLLRALLSAQNINSTGPPIRLLAQGHDVLLNTNTLHSHAAIQSDIVWARIAANSLLLPQRILKNLWHMLAVSLCF